MLSLLIGSIKREHGPIHSPDLSMDEKRGQRSKTATNENKNRKKATTSPNGQRSSSRITAACVLKIRPCVKQPQTQHITMQEPGEDAKNNTSRCGNPGPPSQDPGDHNEKPTGHNRHLHPIEIAQCNMKKKSLVDYAHDITITTGHCSHVKLPPRCQLPLH